MKRIITAIFLLLLIVALCITAVLWQQAQTEKLMQKIEVFESSFDVNAPEDSLRDALRLIEDFEQMTALYPLFLRHGLLNEAETELHTLPALIQKGEPLDVAAALVRCKVKLEALYYAELPFWGNIF